jgi:hypothetical protein
MKTPSRRETPEDRSAERAQPLICEHCGRAMAGYQSVTYGSPDNGFRELCGTCFNQAVADRGSIEFDHVQFEPIDVPDAGGATHRLHFEVRLFGNRVSLEAFELIDDQPGGYQFQVIGDVDGDLFELMGRMVLRIRRLLGQQHLEAEAGTKALHIADLLARGRITWDDNEDGRLPMLVIDGKEISWERFGELVMAFEGWQFKFELKDPSDEI